MTAGALIAAALLACVVVVLAVAVAAAAWADHRIEAERARYRLDSEWETSCEAYRNRRTP